MKVLHINASNSGGAAKAAIRLHLALLDSGIESEFLYLAHDANSNIRNSHQFPKFYPSFLQRVIRKLGLRKFRNEKISELYSYAKGEFDSISYFESDYKVHQHRLFQEADIINLHWIGNFIDFPSFFLNCKKPVVWTLHDKNPCMGCFHLLSDSHRGNNLKELDEKFAKEKSEILSRFQNLHVVAPSKVLMDYSQNSSALEKFAHSYIANSIDTQIYKDLSCFTVKQLLSLPPAKINILVFTYPLSVYHKGMDLLLDAFQKHEFPDLHFLFIGSFDNRIQTKNTYSHIPFVKDELFLSIIYSVVDILLITSREENLPNVMIEAMSCGTPVLSFPVGGMLDVIKTGFNGVLTEELSIESLVATLTDVSNNKYSFSRKDIRDYAVQNFSPSVQADKYIQLYEKILSC